MYGAFAYAELFGSAADSRPAFYDVFAKLNSALLHNTLHIKNLQNWVNGNLYEKFLFFMQNTKAAARLFAAGFSRLPR